MTTLDKKYELIVKEWQKALRSGDYKQTKETLVDNGSYCCLGVFCKMNDFSNFGDYGDFTDYFNFQYDSELDNCKENDYKAELFNEFLNLEFPPVGIHKPEKYCSNLVILQSIFINLNDEAQLSFSEIADWIDKNIDFN